MKVLPCIFCRSLDAPRTREHVLQAALGASMTLPSEVCADCNAAFSPLDQDLVEYASIFIRGHATRMLGLGLQDDPTTGVRLTARLGMRGHERGMSVSPPQVFRLPDGSWQFRGGSTDVLAAMLQELARPVTDVDEVVDEVGDGLPVALAVVRTAPNTFLVRGSDSEAVGGLARLLRTEGMQHSFVGPAREWVPPPKVEPITRGVKIPVGRIARAVAKVALNYLCGTLGAAVALRPEFDALRRFARYDEGAFLDFVSLALLDEAQRETVNAFAHPARHALVLVEVPDGSMRRAGVQLVLYGTPVAVVRLASAPVPLLPPGTWRVAYFDHAQRTFEELRIPDDGLRCFVNLAAIVPGASELMAPA